MRARSIITILVCVSLFTVLLLLNYFLDDAGLSTDLHRRNLSPSIESILGTDWLGRDMFTRIVKGSFVSFQIGILSAVASSVLAMLMGIIAATFGKKIDYIVTFLIDMFLSVPHIVLLILVSFAIGGGVWGIIIAVAVSHWPRLARIIRAEILQLKSADYVLISYKLGRPKYWVIINHMTMHVFSQFLIGLILMFPHALSHAAGLSFLGFGLSPERPCIGVLISESMRHLSTGYWWLAVFPGIALVIMVKLFDIIGDNFTTIISPRTSQE